ncbi:hypothetical protein OG458_42060 (plasmid) [Streptomyces sp. NBC_01281]|uniref:hypothetical protein n=1 Tax=Streptomyces sp. NBC_01281 TaxID=2903811 RepID=UPI002E122AE5|nr:hypothetical protein OG458_42060 [Streptomyces sp. NBC_01281]
MPTEPDADEQALKARLIALIEGTATATQPQPSAQPDAPAAVAATVQPQASAQAQPQASAQAQPPTETATQPDAATQPSGHQRIYPWWSGKSTILTPNETAAQPATPTLATVDVSKDAATQPDETEEGEEDESATQPDAATQPTRWPTPRVRRPAPVRKRPSQAERVVSAPAPRMSLLDAVNNVTPRVRWLVVHASAAAIGYRLGWVQWATRTNDWLDHHGYLNPNAFALIGLAVGAELLRRAFREEALVIRLLAAIPVASIAIGTALYGVGWQNLELPL